MLMNLISAKTRYVMLSAAWRKRHHPTFIRFDIIDECDGRTDGRTDAVADTARSIASRCKNQRFESSMPSEKFGRDSILMTVRWQMFLPLRQYAGAGDGCTPVIRRLIDLSRFSRVCLSVEAPGLYCDGAARAIIT